MDEQFNFKKQYRKILVIAMAGGLLVSVLAILIFKPGPSRIWANVLLNNQFFLGIALGASFFMAVHMIAWSGWHSVLQRLPESMTTFLPVAFVLMLLIYFGMHDIYHWSHYEGYDAILRKKSMAQCTIFLYQDGLLLPWLDISYLVDTKEYESSILLFRHSISYKEKSICWYFPCIFCCYGFGQ